MSDLLSIKFNRSFWIIALEKNDISKAVDLFNKYIFKLNEIINNNVEKEDNDDIKKEIVFSQNLFKKNLNNKANQFYSNNDYISALECLTFLMNIDKNYEVTKKYINCLIKSKQVDLAEHYLDELVNNSSENTYKEIAQIYEDMELHEKSCHYMQKYVDFISKKSAVSAYDYNLLGLFYNRLYISKHNDIDTMKKCLMYYKKAQDIVPSSRLYSRNLTYVYTALCQYDNALNEWRKYIASGNLSYNDMYDYSLLCWSLGLLEEWQKYYNARLNMNATWWYYPNIPKPMWDGKTDISDKILLVHWEQGYGDTVMMCKYIPLLKKYAKKIILVVQEPLLPLFVHNNDLGIEIRCDIEFNVNTESYDYHLPIMSIPIVLKMQKKDFQDNDYILKLNSDIIETFRNKYFNNNQLKIGLSFHGKINPYHRDVSLKIFELLNSIPNTKFYILNKDISDEDREICQKNQYIHIAENCNDFEETAAAIMNCDLIISTDNVILNLAGLLGQKTFALFNTVSEYRWFDLSGEDVIYYKSVKPFVNKEFNQWDESIRKIKELIEQF